ncbi:MAG: hypothetical protein WC545_01750 [Patescibacteria group bacterium]
MKKLLAIVLIIVFTGVGVVGAYYYQNQKSEKRQNEFNNQISALQTQLAELKTEPMAEDKDNTMQFTVQELTSIGLFPSIDSPILTTCAFWKNIIYSPINTNDAAGTLEIEGQILERIGNATWDEEKQVTRVYLLLSDPVNDQQKKFYDHYMAMAQDGNGINKTDNQQLLFRLGIKENTTLTTSANISNELRSRLISLIGKNDVIKLKVTIPYYPGGGVGEKFSFACDISE